ncbi:MAG: formylglycine-generating enzyme family protein, partial [Muribaculaceae bacterium]|nr:formylglycine-generating enzyme family protein [Muribaculaceae bacterium]MBR0023607.1 formylglycine-generating enzyme family protein [Muribaculaceae bacterium]
EDALKEISKNWNKYVKAVEKSGDIILGILGLHEHSFYYDLSLKFDEHGAADVETQTFTVNGVSFTMVGVEGGTFMMGAADGDSEAYSDERPRHQVTLSSFAIGQTEVTQELWQAVMGSNPSYYYGNSYGTNLKRPVEYVSWNDCQDFFVKLNAITGKKFRLPTEAEWEFAARGGNNSRGYKYSGSNTLGEVAWYWDNIPSQSSGTSGYGTQSVATKQANELGLYDMSGNVWEWCQDWYNDSYYSSSQSVDPTGPSSGSIRVFRGGGWDDFAWSCRLAGRGDVSPDSRYSILGLRLAL